MFIEESAISVPLPVKERCFQLDMPVTTETLDGRVLHDHASEEDMGNIDIRENMGVAAYMIRAIALWGRIVAYTSQGGKERDPHPISSRESIYTRLVADADEFQSTLTESLLYTFENLALHNNHNTANQFLLLHLTLQQNILALALLALASKTEDEEAFTSIAKGKAFAAANRISTILKDAEGSRYTITAPFAAYCAFSSTVFLIQGIVSSDINLKAQSEANSTVNIRFIRKMMKFWGMFHWLEEDIRTQYRIAMDRNRAGLQNRDADTLSPIPQYGDWFTRYPNGVADSDFFETGTQKKKEKGADGVLEQKPELQSVEEFFTTLASPQGNGKQEGLKPGTAKRKPTAKKQASASVPPAQQQPQKKQQQRRASAAPIGQNNSSAATNGLVESTSEPTIFQSAPAVSPISMDHFAHPGQQGYYPPNIISVNLQQQPNHVMQPLDHQLSFGGYPLPQGHVANSQSLMGGTSDWGSTPQGHDTSQDSKSDSHSSLLNGHGHSHGHLGPSGLDGANIPMDASSAWYMPYGLEAPHMNQEIAIDQGNADTFNNIYHNGMAPSNPLGGLRHAQ